MKNKLIKSGILLLAATILNSGCKKILEENPQSGIVPSFFASPSGVLGGIAGVYNDIRSASGVQKALQQKW